MALAETENFQLDGAWQLLYSSGGATVSLSCHYNFEYMVQPGTTPPAASFRGYIIPHDDTRVVEITAAEKLFVRGPKNGICVHTEDV